MGQKNTWTENETTLALALYYQLPSNKHDVSEPKVIQLANHIGRSPGAVVFKLGNLKNLDKSTTQIGFSHGSKMDSIVFDKYLNNIYELFTKRDEIMNSNELLVAESTLPKSEIDKLLEDIDFSIEDKKALIKVREKQYAFRQALLTGYGWKCCLSEVDIPDFLIASHIKPWAVDKANRINPQNGLLLNAFLDKAFDKGYFKVIPEDYTVIISDKIKHTKTYELLMPYDGQKIKLPHNKERWPNQEFLAYHEQKIFNSF